MLITCKQIARKLANKKLRDFPPIKRWWIKLHIKMCVVCGEYQRNAVKFQEAEQNFSEKDDFAVKLDDEAKARLRKKLKKCCSKNCS